ncbi:MAG: DUF2946 family protein [Rubripirellula sp.]
MRYASRLICLLTIASLLVGNVAGWVHVGHHCGGGHHEVQQKVDQHQGCCHHHCHQDDEQHEPDQPHGDHEHDPDTCSICQSFFAFRLGLPTVAQPDQWQPAETADFCLVVSDVAVEKVFLSALSSRGPPRV